MGSNLVNNFLALEGTTKSEEGSEYHLHNSCFSNSHFQHLRSHFPELVTYSSTLILLVKIYGLIP